MDCIFCRIANGEIPSATVYEDDLVRVILDLGPAARGHALVLPKEHFKDSTEAPEALLGHVMDLLRARGYAVGNVDATIVAQRPKMKTYIPQMEANIARVLGVELDQVNVKATTEEKLGFTGTEQGISAYAVCGIEKQD